MRTVTESGNIYLPEQKEQAKPNSMVATMLQTLLIHFCIHRQCQAKSSRRHNYALLSQRLDRQNLQYCLALQSSSLHLQQNPKTYLLPQLFVFGLQILAMATPRCIKLYQDVFVFCINNFIKVLSNHHLTEFDQTS